MLDAVCYHVTSSAASRDSEVKLTTDHTKSGLHIKPASNFSIAYTVCKINAKKYGDAFSKSSSIDSVKQKFT